MRKILSLINQGTKFTVTCPSGTFIIDADHARHCVTHSLVNIKSAAGILIFGDGKFCITIEFAK